MNLFSKHTRETIVRETGKFTSANYSTEIKKYGGFDSYVISLGGVFAKWHNKKITVTTVSQFNEICEYIFGLMFIFRFCYWNGKTWWFWLNNATKAFYVKKVTDKGCRGGTINQLCQGTDSRLRITNCNYGVDTLLKQLGWYKKSSDSIITWATQFGKPVAEKKQLKKGDIVHFFSKSLDRTKPSTWKGKGWHHVVMVYKIEGDKIWCIDFGNRFIKSSNPLHYMILNNSAHADGEYNTYYWAGIHAFELEDDTVRIKTIADKAVELTREIYNFLAVKKKEYGDEVYDMSQEYLIDRDAYLRACADYVLNGYAGSGDARKAFFGEDYDDVQSKVNWVIKTAKEVIEGKYGSGEARKEALGKDYDVVQAEVNRLLKG